ncbi:MAG: FAD-dependent oxidoreductase [Desulfovermiculus sp.]
MGKKIVIIGAVALGPKVASRVKRLMPDAQVTLVDRDDLISYGGCGIPYYIGGDVADVEGLYSTSSHAVRDNQFFKDCKRVDVLTHTEARAIDRRAKKVRVLNLQTQQEQELEYDHLVLATGGSPVVPPLPGADLPGVFVVSNLHQAQAIKDRVAKGKVEQAVVIGGGAIGLEMAEALADLWGVKTSIVEMMDHVLPMSFDQDMAGLVQNHIQDNEVQVRCAERVKSIAGSPGTGVQAVETDQGTIPCDLVILAVGVRPNSRLARNAGLATGAFGGIIVDQRMQTSDPSIFAGGDCVEITNLVSGHRMPLYLGSLANRQGRIIGTNLAGGSASFPGAVGNFCLKMFDIGVASAGLTTAAARRAGFDPVASVVVQSDRAHFYPANQLMYLRLIADRNTRRILGVQAVGGQGDAVKARVDAVAAAMHSRATVADIACLEVAYAPPFASAMDIVNNAANALENIINGFNDPIEVPEFISRLENDQARVLDVRGSKESHPFVNRFGERWLNIPQAELESRILEINTEKPLMLLCDTGPRSYEAQLVLRSHNINETSNLQGGFGMIKASVPDFIPQA